MTRLGRELKQKTESVLRCVQDYEAIHQPDKAGIDIDFLRRKRDSIRGETFRIAVVGEVKAGKSSLINTLLGEKLLPSDILQASSAIVEIKKSDDKYLEIQYADGAAPTRHAFSEVTEMARELRGIGSVADEYRDIPASSLDRLLQEVGGSAKQISDQQLRDAFTQASMEGDDQSMALARSYLQSRSLAEIPKAIHIHYPLDFDYDGVSLVDSPGVNAVGGVEDATFKYLNDADALIFAHSLKEPVESTSVKDFIKENIADRHRDQILFVLTHKAAQSPLESKGKYEEARRLYQGLIAADRIITVDSILPRIFWDIERIEPKDISE